MVSSRSFTRPRSCLSNSVTGSAGVRRTGSPKRRIGWTATSLPFARSGSVKSQCDAAHPMARGGGSRPVSRGRADPPGPGRCRAPAGRFAPPSPHERRGEGHRPLARCPQHHAGRRPRQYPQRHPQRHPQRTAPARAPGRRAEVSAWSDRDRAEHLGAGGQLQRSPAACHGGRGPGQGRRRHGGRQPQLGPLGQLTGGVPGRVRTGPSAWTAAAAGSAQTTTTSPVGRRPDQRRGGPPPAQRLLAGPQVGTLQQARRRPAARPRRTPGPRAAAPARQVASTRPPRAGTAGSARSGRDTSTRAPGNARPSSSAVRSTPTARARSRRPAQCGQVHRTRAPTPGARRPARARHPRRAAAPHGPRCAVTGPLRCATALRGRTAPAGTRPCSPQRPLAGGQRAAATAALAGQSRAGSRPAAPAPAPARGQTRPARPARRPAAIRAAGGRRPRPRGPSVPATRPGATRAHRRAVGHDLAGPAVRPPAGRPPLSAPSRPSSSAAPDLLGPQGQHLADVRVRRPRLGVQVVAVVPDHHQAEVGHRGERRGPGAHAPPAPCRAAPRGRRGTGRPVRDPPPTGRAGPARARRPARRSTASTSRRSGTTTSAPRPAATVAATAWAIAAAQPGPGQRRPHRARRLPAAPAVPGRPARPGSPPTPRAADRYPGRTAPPGRTSRPGSPHLRTRWRLATCLQGRPFGLGVPGRDGEPQHVGQRAGVPVGDRPGQPQHLRGEHGSADTTRRSGVSRPACSLPSARSTT